MAISGARESTSSGSSSGADRHVTSRWRKVAVRDGCSSRSRRMTSATSAGGAPVAMTEGLRMPGTALVASASVTSRSRAREAMMPSQRPRGRQRQASPILQQ